MLWKMAPRLALLLLMVKDLQQLLAAMQEGFATLPGNMADAISEAFTSVKALL